MSEMTVSRLAEQVGVSADAVRYYERIGILPEADRSPSGYRLYDDDAVERLGFVKRAQRFGLRLEAIAELLDIRERGLCPCGHARTLLERRVQALDEEMATLAELRRDIERMLDEPDGLLQARPDHEKGGMTMTTDKCECGCAPEPAPTDAADEACTCGCDREAEKQDA